MGVGDQGIYSPCNMFGSGAPVNSPVPMQVSILSNVEDIKTSQNNSTQVVLKKDGTLWRWGSYSSSVCLETPAQIPLDQVVAVNVFYSSVYAIRSDGSLWTWSWDTPSSPPAQLLTSGVLGFADGGLVRMADGHLLNLNSLAASSQSPTFAVKTFGNGYSGRLNLANVTVGDDSELQVAISSDTQTISTGQNFNYVISVSNLGTGAAANSIVSVALPTAVSINSVPAGCSAAGQIITCNLGNVAASYATSLSINVKALSVASTTATAYISADAYDYSSANNSAGVDIAIQAPSSGVDGDVPTLPEWGAILLGGLLVLTAHRRMAQARPTRTRTL